MLKRTFDISLSLLGLILLSPIFVVIAVLIWSEDRGSILFFQRRIGKYKIPFNIIKFRTFRRGEITLHGQWLRERGLDELPQLFNVLLGSMSVVGPRPLTDENLARIGWHSAYYNRRWNIKPGLTGLAQIYAGRGSKLSWFYDKQYIEKESLFIDSQVIVISFFMNLIGKYRVRQWLQGENRRENNNWLIWEKIFKTRQNRPLPHVSVYGHHTNLPNSLAKSLAIFQLGESGGGTIIQQVKRSRLTTIDKNYYRAISLFVAEEHRHAEILARCVKGLGGRLITSNWTENLFLFSRRLMGIRLKVTVLLAAEVVGICYYRLIASKLPVCEVKDCLNQLATDEQSHLQFHCEFLRNQARNNYLRLLFSCSWYCLLGVAMVVVIIDHRKAINDLGIPYKLLLRRWIAHVKLVDELVTHKTPNLLRLVEIDNHLV